MGHIMPGHPFVESKNHASKGVESQNNMGGSGAMGDFDGKSMRVGGGGRFEKLSKQVESPALAAFIGRKKYGAKKMASMAAKGRK